MTETVLPPFHVSEAAIRAIEDLGGAVRVDLEEGGCCGTTYAFSLVDPQAVEREDESRYGCPGAWLFVSPAADAVLAGARLDFGASLKPARFRITRNPNTPDVCSCRRSFGRPWPGPGQPTCRSYLPMPWDNDFDPPVRWGRQTGYES